jgi:hypothetical protein
MMKSVIETVVLMCWAAFLLTTALVDPAAAEKQKHITGTVTEHQTEVIEVEPGVLLFHGLGTGKATHLGRFMMEIWLYLDLATGSAGGQYLLTTPNGDMLSADFTAVGVPTEEDPSVIHFMETGIISGGTGRFACATGTITREGFTDSNVAKLGGTISLHSSN